MPGASPETRRVKNVNANWSADTDAPHGRFELMLITDDDRQHFLPVSPASTTAILGLARADTVLA